MVSITPLKQKFFCDTKRCLFRYWTINCGIHGSLLFLIYKDDLPQVLNETGSYCYADETCIFYQDKDAEKVGKELNTEFLSLCEWFIDKKLYN